MHAHPQTSASATAQAMSLSLERFIDKNADLGDPRRLLNAAANYRRR